MRNQAMTSINNRRHDRIKHRASIRVMVSPEKMLTLNMFDFSESGMYLFCDDDVVALGDRVEVQTLEIEDAPILETKVVRIDKSGFAVAFI